MEKIYFPGTPGSSDQRGRSNGVPHAGSMKVGSDPEMDKVIVEGAKKSFLATWAEYVDAIKRGTEVAERQSHLARYEEVLSDKCQQAIGALDADVNSLPVHGAIEYRHIPSLIENAKSYTTNPKYVEWQPGIISALPALEDALATLKHLEIPAAEKDIIDAVRIAVNTPFMQMIRAKDRLRELQAQLEQGMPDQSFGHYLQAMYSEFQACHKDRKVAQALELVRHIEAAVVESSQNYTARLECFGEAKKLMNAALDPVDPLNINDLEPPREQALELLHAKMNEVKESQELWTRDRDILEKAADAENIIGLLNKEAHHSSEVHKHAAVELEAANDEVKRCWDALMAAQDRACAAEKQFVVTKLKEEVDHQLVKDVTEEVEKHKGLLEDSIRSCKDYCDVLRSVERYINARWEPWKEVVKHEAKALVTEVCEVYTISEKSLGDLIDRKMMQVEAAAKEEKDCMEKYNYKWEQLDPLADNEKHRALEAQKVKEAAQHEAERMLRVKEGLKDVLELCRPVMDSFNISIEAIERRAALEEWGKRRLRLYQEFEDLTTPLIAKVAVLGQSGDQQTRIKTLSEDQSKRINNFLLSIPPQLAAPVGCERLPDIMEKQRKTAGDVIVRTGRARLAAHAPRPAGPRREPASCRPVRAVPAVPHPGAQRTGRARRGACLTRGVLLCAQTT